MNVFICIIDHILYLEVNNANFDKILESWIHLLIDITQFYFEKFDVRSRCCVILSIQGSSSHDQTYYEIKALFGSARAI